MNNTATATTTEVDGTDDRIYELDAYGVVTHMFRGADIHVERTCSICDGLGHGYDGIPCPLEDRGNYSDEPYWAQ